MTFVSSRLTLFYGYEKLVLSVQRVAENSKHVESMMHLCADHFRVVRSIQI